RLLRVRLCAWELAEGRPLSAAGLAAIAAVAVELNRIAGPAASRPLAWLRLRRGLSELHTVWPAPVLIVADLMAIRWLCRHTGQAAVDDEVRAALRQLPQLARWGAAAIAGSPRTELYISAHALRGDEVSERPELVRAKLAGRVVRAPYDRVAAVRDSYAEAALG
ncbi:MAG TPA: hypothetical protein VFN19_04500, partial [Candidatus Nanopelagicales bacterium]|nr:hypothetical protein [Candidatus Nanopelagicales bacterium]